MSQAGYVDPEDPQLPPDVRPILEELPKWNVLSDIMDEVEAEMYHAPQPEGNLVASIQTELTAACIMLILFSVTDLGQDTVLIMVQDQRTCSQLKRYLSTQKTATTTRGKPLMRDLFQGYLRWKSNMKHFKDNLISKKSAPMASNQGTTVAALAYDMILASRVSNHVVLQGKQLLRQEMHNPQTRDGASEAVET